MRAPPAAAAPPAGMPDGPPIHPLYKELIPPTTVTGCVEAAFTDPAAENVIVARAHVLQVYAVEWERSGAAGPTPRLGLVWEGRLNGVVSSLAAVEVRGGRQRLLAAFSDAKMALLEWQPERHTVETLSIHFYERDELKRCTNIVVDGHPPLVRCDPGGRCAMLAFYGTQIAVLPLAGGRKGGERPWTGSWVFPVRELDAGIRFVLDIVFLHGYIEPTVAILYSGRPTWSGRLACARDTCGVIVVSVPAAAGARGAAGFPVLYHVQQLPYNCERLVACPAATGGMLVVSANGLLFVDHATVPGLSLATNAFFGLERGFLASGAGARATGATSVYDLSRVTDARALSLDLGGCAVAFVTPDEALVVLRTGELVLVHLSPSPDAGQRRGWQRRRVGVSGFSVERLSLRASPPGTRETVVRLGQARFSEHAAGTGALLACARGLAAVFVGSAQADCQLLVVDLLGDDGPGEFREVAASDAFAMEEDADDVLLYGAARAAVPAAEPTTKSDAQRLTVAVADQLTVLGSLRSLAVGETTRPGEDVTYEADPLLPRPELEMVGCGGDDDADDGTLVVLQRSVRPTIDSSFQMSDRVQGVWTVRLDGPHDAYVFLSTDEQTLVFAAGAELQQVADGDLQLAAPTVHVGALGGGAVVQVVPNAIVVVDGTTRARLARVEIAGQSRRNALEDQWAVAGRSCGSHLALVLNTGALLVYFWDGVSLTVVLEDWDASATACFLYGGASEVSPGSLSTRGFSGGAAEVAAVGRVSRAPVDSMDEDGAGEDEEAYLYGGSGGSTGNTQGPEAAVKAPTAPPQEKGDHGPDPALANLYLVTVDEARTLKIRAVDSCGRVAAEPALTLPEVHQLPSVLATRSVERDLDADAARAVDGRVEEIVWVNLGQRTGPGTRTLYMVIRLDSDAIAVYRAFRCAADSVGADNLAVRFARVPLGTLTQDSVVYRDLDGDKAQPVEAAAGPAFLQQQRLYPFAALGGGAEDGGRQYDGVFVAGPRPQWLLCARGPMGDATWPELPTAARPTSQQLAQFDAAVVAPASHAAKRAAAANGAPLAENTEAKLVAEPTADELAREAAQDAAEEAAQAAEAAAAARRRGAARPQAAGHDEVRLHPASGDGAVACFAPFHSAASPHGFVYFNRFNKLRIARLPRDCDLGFWWPLRVRRLPGRVVHRIALHHASGMYVAVTARRAPFSLAKARFQAAVAAHTAEEDEVAPRLRAFLCAQGGAAGCGLALPVGAQFSLEVIAPGAWDSADEVVLDDNDAVLALACVSLTNRASRSGRTLYVAAGCGTARGEDLAARGRLVLYELSAIVPDPARPWATHRFKKVAVEDVKAPVTALCDVNGYLLAAVGQKAIVYELERAEALEGVAFIDIGLFAVTVAAVKGLVVLGDAEQGVRFLAFQDEPPRLKQLGHDYWPLATVAVQFLIDGAFLYLVAADAAGNVHLFEYAPHDTDAELGKRLLRRAEFHVGAVVSQLVRLRALPAVQTDQGFFVAPRSHFLLGATGAGAVCALAPVPRKLHARLDALAARLVGNVRPLAGLNPRAFRVPPNSRTQLARRLHAISLKAQAASHGVLAASLYARQLRSAAVLDGDLLHMFADIPRALQLELAKIVGSDPSKVLDDLLEVQLGLEYF